MKKSLFFLLILFMIPVTAFGIQGNEPANADTLLDSSHRLHVLELKERIMTPDYEIIGVTEPPGGLPATVSINYNFPEEKALELKEKMAGTIIMTEAVPKALVLPDLGNGWRILTPYELHILELKERVMTPDMR